MPRGQEGNSEAGHINMGAGRTIKQDVVRIDEAIESGEFDKNAAILLAIDNAKRIIKFASFGTLFRWWASCKNNSSQTNFEIGKREGSQKCLFAFVH